MPRQLRNTRLVRENLRLMLSCTVGPPVLSSNWSASFMISQPYGYQRHELAEPDWRRFPGWAGVSAADWESAQWQRAHCVKNARPLRQAAVGGAGDAIATVLERGQRQRATTA